MPDRGSGLRLGQISVFLASPEAVQESSYWSSQIDMFESLMLRKNVWNYDLQPALPSYSRTLSDSRVWLGRSTILVNGYAPLIS